MGPPRRNTAFRIAVHRLIDGFFRDPHERRHFPLDDIPVLLQIRRKFRERATGAGGHRAVTVNTTPPTSTAWTVRSNARKKPPITNRPPSKEGNINK